MNKNQQCEIRIEDMGTNGEGIGKYEGYTLFVKDAVVGDLAKVKVIKAKKNYGYGRLLEIVEPSPFRVEPVCPHYKRCGGCQLQPVSYEKQLEWKENKVRNNLERIGGLTNVPIKEVIGMEEPFRYRNKAQYPVGWRAEKENDGRQSDQKQMKSGQARRESGALEQNVRKVQHGKIVAGFYAERTHTIIDSDDCALGHEVNGEILRRVKSYMEKYGVKPYDEETGSGLVRHVLIREGFQTGELMVCIIVNGNRLPKEEALTDALRDIPGMTSIMLNVNRQRSNVILGEELRRLWGREYISDYIGNVKFSISPLSFFQVNPVQTEKLYRRVMEYAGLESCRRTEEPGLTGEICRQLKTGGEEGISEQEAARREKEACEQPVIWDLYCGIGSISLFLAQKAKQVYGVEIVPAAVEDARKNAAANGITNVEFFTGKAEEIVPQKYAEGYTHADVVVVDPPRKGCDQVLLDTVAKMEPEWIVYVSCDSATLARDLKYLGQVGYEVKEVTVCDMFPMTVHCECVAKVVRTER